MEQKKKRGRPRKIEEPQDQEKIEEITQDIKEKEDEEIHEMIQELKKEHNEWDYPIGRDVPYFDPKCSYELSGYKPIDGTHGLDFDPSWFTEASTTYNNTNRFCSFVEGSKAWHDFWELQYKRMRNGMTVNGYTITGDHYYFLNFYRLNDLTSATKSGSGRKQIFPRFCVAQYEYFHYLELCKQLKKDAIGLKARGVGFSEIAASLVTNTYHCRKNSLCLITAQQQVYVEKTFAKVVVQLNFGNEHSQGGLFKLRQKKDTALNKKASIVQKINGQEVESGWGSELNCIVADKPNKIRGDRTDVLLYEESGSWPSWKKAYLQGEALVEDQGSKFGIRLAWGKNLSVPSYSVKSR